MRALALLALVPAVASAQAVVEPTVPPATAFARCAVCHTATGAGIPGAFPPLNNHIGAFAGTEPGREYLVMAVSGGLAGQIVVEGESYAGMMPNQGGLGDAGIADALNYALLTWNKLFLPAGWKPFTADEVKAIRARHADWQPADGAALRDKAVAAAAGH